MESSPVNRVNGFRPMPDRAKRPRDETSKQTKRQDQVEQPDPDSDDDHQTPPPDHLGSQIDMEV